jgi:hypothetical protein
MQVKQFVVKMNRRILNSDDEEFDETLSDRNFQLESEKDNKF